VGLLRPPNVELYARIGHIDRLTQAAGSKRWPEEAAAARKALQERMDLLIDTLGSKNLRRVLTARAALKAIGRPATRALIEKLDDPHRERRQDVVHALGEIGDPYAVKALVGRLRDADGLVRQLACRSLSRIGDARALGSLRRAVAADPDASVRKTAAEAVKRIERIDQVAARHAAGRVRKHVAEQDAVESATRDEEGDVSSENGDEDRESGS
jgi:HEAT repeat protein